jgi:small-conductance mechanosensitive channel
MDVANAQVLDFLVGGSLIESGESLMQQKYNINDDITTYTIEQWADLHDRAKKAQWFIDNYEEIKAKFETVINGQIKFRQFQGWLYDKGFKGASNMKEAEIKALIAENDHLEAVKQQDHRLTKEKERATSETTEFKRGIDAEINNSIEAYKAKINKDIAALAGNPQFQAAIEEWKNSKSQELAWATAALKGGSHGLAHPKFAGANTTQPAFGGGSAWTWGGQRARATDAVNRNVARAVNNAASNFGRGLGKIGSFFGIGR